MTENSKQLVDSQYQKNSLCARTCLARCAIARQWVASLMSFLPFW